MNKSILLLLFLSFGAKAQQKPLFAFDGEKVGERNASINAEVKKYIIKINASQQEEVLSNLLHEEVNPMHYLHFVQRFYNAFDEVKRKKFNELFPDWAIADPEEITKNEWSSENGGYYPFCGLDFNADGKADLFLIPEVFFGPSPGLVIYGYQKGKIVLFSNIAGDIVSFKKRGDDIILQYGAILIEQTETEILQTIIYNAKAKSCSLDSKIYYATQTKFPEKLGKPRLFKTIDSVALRYDKTLNDTIYTEEQYNDYELNMGSKTLRGNVVAVYPKNAKAYLLAEDKDYAFVAFLPESSFLALSLRHGMEYFYFEDDKLIDEPKPKPYILGWVEKRLLLLTK
jgi:hypothetical protein